MLLLLLLLLLSWVVLLCGDDGGGDDGGEDTGEEDMMVANGWFVGRGGVVLKGSARVSVSRSMDSGPSPLPFSSSPTSGAGHGAETCASVLGVSWLSDGGGGGTLSSPWIKGPKLHLTVWSHILNYLYYKI